MAAEDILGISTQMNISDIQKAFDNIINNLNSLGVKTDEVSSKMSKALNDISQSAVSNEEKSKQAIEVYKNGIAEINKVLETTPEQLKKLGSEATTAEATLGKLKQRLSDIEEGSTKWDGINEQIKNQQQLVNKLNGEYDTMLGTFGSTQQYVGSLNAAIETLNAGRSVSTAVTGASAAAHTGVAVAVGAETITHAANAQKIEDETQRIKENTEALNKSSEAIKSKTKSSDEEVDALERLSKRLQDGKLSEEEYVRAVQNANERIKQLTKEREEIESKRNNAYDNYENAYNKRLTGELSVEESDKQVKQFADITNSYSEQFNKIDAQIRKLQTSVTSLMQTYNLLHETRQQQASSESKQINETVDAIKAKENEIKRLREEYEKLYENKPSFFGIGTDLKEGSPLLSSYKNWSAQVDETKKKISETEEELSKLKDSVQTTVNTVSDIWAGKGKNEIAEIITKDIEQLKILSSEIKNINDKNSEKAKENKRRQAEINDEISQGKDRLRQVGTSYEDVAKEAKKAAKETEKIGKNANEAGKTVNGFFATIKDSVKGVLKGDFSSMWSLFAKIGVFGTALGAIGKGLYDLTVRAEEFRNALQPLSHYIDENRLADVRQNILALSSTTTKSVADMAQAATQFVKVWDGLKDSSDALITMVKSANEFGALAGKTSEESAKYLSNLASEYHMTAHEATQASNMIATASHNSTSTFSEMADALSSAGSNASMYGVSFKDMATLIGYSSNQFGGASQAASKFSMLLMNMEKMQDKKYKPSVVGMVQALQNLKEAMDNGELSEKTFQGRIRQTARYFINNADAIAEYGKHIDSTKAKEELLADANARASVNVNKLKNAWDGFLTSFNANLTPVLTHILQFFNKIIGGAQKTADELNYLKNFDKNHKDTKQKVNTITGGITGDPLDAAVVSMGASSRYATNKEDGLKAYQAQRDRLKRRYQQGLNIARNKWKNASGNAYANAAGNFMLDFYNKNRNEFSEFTPQMFNELLRNQRASTMALSQKTKNTNDSKGGDFTTTSNKKAEELAKQQRQYREQQAEQQAKQLADDKKIEWELYVAEQEKGIAEMHEGNEKELAQRRLDFEKKKHQIEEEAESLRQKNISVAKAAYDKNPANKKKEGFYASGLDKNVTLTDEQMKLIQAKKEKVDVEYNSEFRKQEKESIDALNAYIKEYGTYLQKRLAISKEYEQKIQDAQSQGEKNKLKAQMDKELSELDFNEFKNKINWEDVFGNLGNLTISQLKAIKEQLRSLLDNGNVDAEKFKTTVEQINSVNNTIIATQDKVKEAFGLLLPMAEQRKILEFDIAEAQERQNEALKQQASANAGLNISRMNAQRTLQKAGITMSVNSITSDNSQSILSKIGKDKGTDSETYKKVSDALLNVAESERKVNEANKNVVISTNNLTTSQSKLHTFLTDFGNKLKSVSETISLVASNLQSLPDLFNELGIDSDSSLGKAASDFSKAGSSATQSISDLQSGNFVGALAGSISTVKSTISGFTNLFGLGGNEKEVARTTENLQKANERLTYSIDALKDSIDKQTGANAVSSYEKAYESQKKANQNAMSILETQMGYHSSHHSNAYYWNLSNDDYNKINSVLKTQREAKGDYTEAKINSVSSLEDIYKLTPEQMKDIRVYASDVWKTMTEQGKYDKSEYWENVTEQAEKLDELTQKINENLTQVSFDSMKSNFLNDLMDMSKSASDVANDMSNDFAEALQKSMLQYALSDTYDKTLKPLYEKWAAAMKDHTLTKTEIDTYKQEYDKAVQEGLKYREQISEITGYTGSQSEQTATGKGIEAITSDQASSLIGIGYAMQIALEQGNDVRSAISIDVSSLRAYAENVDSNISEMRDIQYQGLEQLQAINKNTEPIILIHEDIAGMYKLMKERY